MTKESRGMRSSSSLPLIRRLVSTYLRPYFGKLMGAVFFMLVSAAMTAVFAKLIQPVVDNVLARAGSDPAARDLIIPMGLAVLGCFALRGLATFGQVMQMTKIGQGIVADIQNDLFRHLLRLDLSFFHAHPSGQLTSRMISDVNVMRYAVSDALTGLGNSFLTLVFLIGVMFYQDAQLALIALCVFPLAVGAVAYVGRRLRQISKRLQDQTAHLTDRLAQTFQGIRQVKAYGTEGAEEGRAARAIGDVRALNVKATRVGQLTTPINEVLIGLAIFAIITYGGFKIADGQGTAGSLLSFIAAFALAYEPMKKLARLNAVMQMGLGAAERIFALMDLTPQIKDAPQARVLHLPGAPTLQLQNVTFAYPGADAPALRDVSILFPAGKVTALVGASGGGKSTILNLLLRFYDPQAGAVLVNGSAIDGFTLDSLRGAMALVSQDITIFNASIRDNIAYGRTGAEVEDVIGAAKRAAAHDFIVGLPDGYNTLVGENGVLLSGGQRQRLAIARAMLRDAPVLLLDEATSALDNESEAIVQESLGLLGQGRTTIVIAHRLSTVRHADQIVVLDEGAVVEVGTHDSLLAAGGAYARLHGNLFGAAA